MLLPARYHARYLKELWRALDDAAEARRWMAQVSPERRRWPRRDHARALERVKAAREALDYYGFRLHR